MNIYIYKMWLRGENGEDGCTCGDLHGRVGPGPFSLHSAESWRGRCLNTN